MYTAVRMGAATATLATVTVEPVPARIGRRGFEAADAALDVFEEMAAQATGATCVNTGVLLEKH